MRENRKIVVHSVKEKGAKSGYNAGEIKTAFLYIFFLVHGFSDVHHKIPVYHIHDKILHGNIGSLSSSDSERNFHNFVRKAHYCHVINISKVYALS